MSILIRQVLTAALLLLFSLEQVALASAFSDDSALTYHHHSVVEHNANALLSLLAEENEERDIKDDFSPPLLGELLLPHLFPQAAVCNIPEGCETTPTLRSLPIYTYHCTFLI